MEINGWFGPPPNQSYSNYTVTHTLLEVATNNFQWEEHTIHMSDAGSEWHYTASPWFLIVYPIIITLFIGYILFHYKTSLQKGCAEMRCRNFKIFSLLSGIIFIIAAIYFSIYYLFIYFMSFISISMKTYYCYILLIGPIYFITSIIILIYHRRITNSQA